MGDNRQADHHMNIPDTDLPEADSTPPGRGYADGIRDAVPVIMGYLAIGLAFGVVAKTAGITVIEVAVMSMILYAGSAQFVMVGLIAAGVPASAVIVTIFLVNVRHLLYSAAVSPYVRHLRPWQNALIGAELTDETFAVASSRLGQGGRAGAGWFLGINNVSHATWIVSTTIGAVLGSAITDIRALGFDFALAAMFAALLILQIVNRPAWMPAVTAAAVGGGVALCASLVVPPSWAIIAATLVAATVGMVLEEREA